MEQQSTSQVVLNKKAKEVILCFDKKYEVRALDYLSKNNFVSAQTPCRFKELHEHCSDKVEHTRGLSKALFHLRSLGLVGGDGGKGRTGSNYWVNPEKYKQLKNIVQQLNNL